MKKRIAASPWGGLPQGPVPQLTVLTSSTRAWVPNVIRYEGYYQWPDGRTVHLNQDYSSLGQGTSALVIPAMLRRSEEDLAPQQVALKIASAGPRSVRSALAAMGKEYELLSLCQCPHVVRPMAVGLVEQGEVYEVLLVLERADSSLAQDLANLGKDGGKGVLDQNRTIQIGYQMLEALSVLSERRVVHCDIKPGNILRFGDDVYKLCDFDTSRRIDLSEESVAVDLGAMSEGYMAPEAWQESSVSSKTDEFALAATLWEVHTGSNPFAATFGLDIEERYGSVVMPQAAHNPLLGVLAKMLHPDPARRLSDARAEFMRLRALTLPDPLLPV